MGMVYNAPKVSNYGKHFRSLTVPANILSKGVRDLIVNWASWYVGAVGQACFQSAMPDVFTNSVIQKGQNILTKVLSGALERGAVTFFWTPGQEFAGSGAFGFSLDGQVYGKGGGGISYSLSYYYLAFGNPDANLGIT
jgi:hypothetical protein